MIHPLFQLGQVVATPGALEVIAAHELTPLGLLTRHYNGDWGTLCEEDKALNDEAVKLGNRIFSAYQIAPDVKIWIITEADRSATTILLPSEY
jgi:hypothetical protein